MPGPEACVVVDLGCGDQGKGGLTDFLVRDRGAHTVVRHNGGAQAGHNVVTADGRHHTFAQFGAGTFVPGVHTCLSRHMVLQPWAMVREAEYLARAGVADAFERALVSEAALVITPFHRAANRLRERARGDRRHGSCGVGVGETVGDAALDPERAVRAGHLRDGPHLRARFADVQARKRAELADLVAALRGVPEAAPDVACLEDPGLPAVYVDALGPFTRQARIVGDEVIGARLRLPGAVVFEGAQGVLLDEWRGFHPYTTWSTCTPENALALLAEHGHEGPVHRLGVVRAYATRHGPGPLVTEDPALAARLPDPHNGAHPWQGPFRIGWFDAVTTRYAVRACGGIDGLAVTCLDRAAEARAWRIATRYGMGDADVADLPLGPPRDLAWQGALTERLLTARPHYRTTDAGTHLEAIAEAVEVPVTLVSAGPTARDKRWC